LRGAGRAVRSGPAGDRPAAALGGAQQPPLQPDEAVPLLQLLLGAGVRRGRRGRRDRTAGAGLSERGVRCPAPRWKTQRIRSGGGLDRKSTRLNSSHVKISYAVFCLKKKKKDALDRKITRRNS